MSRSGVDEFYEIVRLLIAKHLHERHEGGHHHGRTGLPGRDACNRLLRAHAAEIADILDGQLAIETPDDLFGQVAALIGAATLRDEPFEMLDACFEALTSRSYKSEKGQYVTPRHVVEMCVRALGIRPGDLVCDPCCGSAAFLKAAADFHQRRRLAAGAADEGDGEAAAHPALFGFDYSRRACQVARLTSLLGAASRIRVAQLDSLALPGGAAAATPGGDEKTIEAHMSGLLGRTFDGFDVVLTNPPFAGEVRNGAYAAAAGQYEMASLLSGRRRIERDALFLERCLRLLRPGGRLAIVLPENKVSGARFAALRSWLFKVAEVRAVVSLHRYTFQPYTGQKAAVLFATKPPTAGGGSGGRLVHLYRAERAGKTSNGSPVWRRPDLAGQPAFEALDHDLDEIAAHLAAVLAAPAAVPAAAA